ncbi:MAG: class I SAM-dependent methyltransferase [Pleurocapsa minor GSE-CHR-MK-17-07R]|jgi:hypothetical protein|nr:class I SAM-dependent methyltransferase [Pleurocapsa minor GSE-CHR-MK 17-07R]
MTPETLAFLHSAAGQALMASLSPDDLEPANELRLITRLRRTIDPSSAGAAIALGRVRLRAVGKFGTDAARLYLTTSALEQASDGPVRRYRASLFQPGSRVLEVCCSIGSDGLALAAAGVHVLGIELDAVRAACARLNAAALGLSERMQVVQADARQLPAAFTGWDGAFYDPARRGADGKRIFDVEGYEPPLSLCLGWDVPRVLVKLAPGVAIESLSGYRGRVEFISADGDLKEALLMHERDALTPAGAHLVAVLLHNGHALRWEREPGTAPPPPVTGQPRAWLSEPDAALIRAGLVSDAALAWGGVQVDESIAYITSDTPPDTPWARSFRVRETIPFNVKHLRALLREHEIGHVTIKKRGTAVTPDVLLPQLKLKGTKSATVILTRCEGRQVALVCDDPVPGKA